jgi:hypothetical protein
MTFRSITVELITRLRHSLYLLLLFIEIGKFHNSLFEFFHSFEKRDGKLIEFNIALDF